MQILQKARREWNEKHSAQSPFPFREAVFDNPAESTGSPLSPSKHYVVDAKN